MQTNIWNRWRPQRNSLLLILEPELQGNLLQEYEHKFEQLPEDQKLSKLCSDVGFEDC